MQTKEMLRERCDVMLVAILGSKLHAETWWHVANKAFAGMTPEGQWILNPNTVYNYLVAHHSGDYQ